MENLVDAAADHDDDEEEADDKDDFGKHKRKYCKLWENSATKSIIWLTWRLTIMNKKLTTLTSNPPFTLPHECNFIQAFLIASKTNSFIHFSFIHSILYHFPSQFITNRSCNRTEWKTLRHSMLLTALYIFICSNYVWDELVSIRIRDVWKKFIVLTSTYNNNKNNSKSISLIVNQQT